jgi:hypothetical protein
MFLCLKIRDCSLFRITIPKKGKVHFKRKNNKLEIRRIKTTKIEFNPTDWRLQVAVAAAETEKTQFKGKTQTEIRIVKEKERKVDRKRDRRRRVRKTQEREVAFSVAGIIT